MSSSRFTRHQSRTGRNMRNEVPSATSPSGQSSSTEEEGGARLSAPGSLNLHLGAMSMHDSAAPTGYSSIAAQRVNHPSRSFTAANPAAMRSNPGFQVGNTPGDDVFLGGCSGNSRTGGMPDMPASRAALLGYRDPNVSTSRTTPGLVTSRSRNEVGGVDAQAFYSHTACVFVANLPEAVKDSRLEVEVTQQFSRFGPVFVKIRRDPKNMPFAFCQFTSDASAQKAMTQGKGIIIHGRACRTEMARANRTFIMYNRQGDEVTLDEARDAMVHFGPLDRCEYLDEKVQEAYGYAKSVLVEFTKFDPARDVVSSFKSDPVYRVVSYDPKKPINTPRVDPDEAWLRRYEVDRQSVYVGNLPNEPSIKSKLWDLFGEVGDVVNVNVITKEGRNAYTYSTFAFVEFARADMAELAARRFNGSRIFGSPIRVERKNSRSPTHNSGMRQHRSMADMGASYQSPAHGRLQRRLHASPEAAEPETPIRSLENGASSTAEGSHMMTPASAAMPYSPAWFPSPNYTTSPAYGVPPAYTTTPQGTPQGMVGAYPYGLYYPQYPTTNSPYSWAMPYMSDPNLAPMAISHSFGRVPIPGSEDTPHSPTRANGAGDEDSNAK